MRKKQSRHRMLFHHLHSYKNYHLPMYFHEYPGYGTFCSASQVQLQETVTGEYYTDDGYQTIEVHPELEDIKYLRTFKFEDLTFRGTIEFRSVCCQPIKDSITVAAFHVGLKEQLHALTELLEQDYVLYHHGYTATELRKIFVQQNPPGFVKEEDLYALAKDSFNWIKERGLGEEIMLQPLYERVKEHTNPARKLLALRGQGVELEDIILEYATI
ncbi:MAG: hypothetical protein J6B50_08515 [Lachnospiraceae bacterium]|nr:hypothetical protein [Lachnospiraceae bacterium]